MLNKPRQTAANDRVSAFVDSQRGLMSFYVAEGQVDSASWQATFGDLRPRSPMLIPRAAAAKGDGLRTNAHCATPDKSGLSFPNGLPKPSNTVRKPDPQPDQDRPSEITDPTPDKFVSSQPRQITRESSPEDESEHLQRLAQRRNRRRARRFAMTGMEAPNESSAKDKQRSNKKRPNTDAGENKQRKKKVTPALLLMQNFSSQSLGKSRLTIKPSPTVGVFNKGKASAKVVTNDRRNKPAGRSISDIVFSESRFLNKAQSGRSESGTPEDDLDCSDDRSDRSVKERAGCRAGQKARLNNPCTSSAADHASAQGCPANSPRSIREDSPPWDIEDGLSAPISLDTATDSPHGAPSANKDVVVEIANCSWASKLNQPGLHISSPQDNTGVAPASTISQPLAQPPTISAYFQPPVTSMERRIHTMSPPRIAQLVSKPLTQDTNQHSMAPQDSYDPPSTPECLRLEISHLDHDRTHYMRVPTAYLSPLPLKSGFQGGQNTEERYLGGSIDDEVQWGEDDPGCFRRVELLGEPWLDDACEGDQGNAAFGGFPVQADELYDERPESIYEYCSGPPHDGVEVLPGVYREDGVDYDNELGTGYTREESPWHEFADNSTTTWDEEPALAQDEWADADEDKDALVQWNTTLPTEYDVEESAPDDEILENEEPECGPRLVQIITEDSLQDELLKTMNSHWRSAHRLY